MWSFLITLEYLINGFESQTIFFPELGNSIMSYSIPYHSLMVSNAAEILKMNHQNGTEGQKCQQDCKETGKSYDSDIYV